MPIVGQRKSTVNMGNGYKRDPIYSFAQTFKEMSETVLNETGLDIYTDINKIMHTPAARNTLKQFYMEGVTNADELKAVDPTYADEMIEDSEEMVQTQFDNDVEAVQEYASMSTFNPVIGMTFPLHKNIMMNNVFDKGAIPKFVAREPKFTISMESRILVTPDGQEIDMFKEQYKIREAIDSTAPFKEIVMALPQTEGATDVLNQIGATDDDNLSIDTYISGIQVSAYMLADDINPETGETIEEDGIYSYWLPVRLRFTPSYGDIDRIIAEEVQIVSRDPDAPENYITSKDVITGFTRKNMFALNSTNGVITSVKLNARLDTSSGMVKTCSVRWKVNTDIVEIGSANPINVPVSPEEVKDLGALYNVNQLSKILSLMKTSLGEYKDGTIKQNLDTSFQTMPTTNKFATTFDFAPRAGYALDHVEWRHKTFMDFLDSVTTGLFQVLNDPNMTVSIFGAPDIVRKVTPAEYTYQTPSSIGPVALDFVKTVVTSDKRVYQFIGTDKLRGNANLIIVLCPRNTDRIVYRIYDYQMYVSNEIRNAANYALPAIHAFERWKFVEYQPVQGRIQIKNPTGLTEIAPNEDPIGGQYMSDFNLIK